MRGAFLAFHHQFGFALHTDRTALTMECLFKPPFLLPVSPIYTHFPAHLHAHRTALTMEELTADEDVELWLFRMPLDVSHPPSSLPPLDFLPLRLPF